MQLNREFFILHSEFQIRSARDPEWADQFAEINREFVLALAAVLTAIIDGLGRQLTHSTEALAQAVIGIVMRANGIASWEQVRSGSKLAESNTKVDSSVVDLIVPSSWDALSNTVHRMHFCIGAQPHNTRGKSLYSH